VKTPGTNGDDRVTNGASPRIYAILAVVVVAFGVVNALSAAHDAFRRDGHYELGLPLLWELTSVAVIVALAPLIAFGVERIRRTGQWWLRASWLAGTVLTFSALHIAGMVMLRKLAMTAAGATYDFGFSLSELVYEFRKDVVTCLLIGTAFWLTGSRRERPADASPSVTPAPDLLWLRDGSARLRIEPRDVTTVSSAGNYVEYGMADGRTHLVRGTLAAEEARLSAFRIMRVHRTRLVNLSRVTSVRAGANGDFELTLDTGQTISGSRRYRGAVGALEQLAKVPVSAHQDRPG